MIRDHEIHIQKLFIFDPVYSKNVSDIYIGTAPSPERGSQKLIIIIEFPRGRQEYQHVMDAVIKQAVRVFDASKHLTPELVLESVLESVNLLLPQLAPRHSSNWLDDLSLLIAIFDRGQLHFSQIGDIQALLVQGASLSVVSEEVREINPLKIFSHITSGLLDPGNALLLTTTRLLDYIAHDKLRKLLQNYPPALIKNKVELLLSQVPPTVAFAAVIIKFTTELDSLATQNGPRPITMQQTQVNNRLPQEESYPIRSQRTDRYTLQEEMPTRRTRSMGSPRGSKVSKTIVWILKHFGFYLVLLYQIVLSLVRGFARALRSIIDARKRREEEQSFIRRTEVTIARTRSYFGAIPRITRWSLITTIVIFFMLINALIIKSQGQAIRRNLDSFNETLLQVGTLKKGADDAIIYKDDTKAEDLLMQIDSLLKNIVPQNKKQADQIAGYREQNDRDINSVRHISFVANPFVYANMQSLPEQSLTDISILDNGSMMITDDKNLYALAVGVPKLNATAPTPLKLLVNNGSAIFAITTDDALLRVSDKGFTVQELQKNSENHAVVAASFYANNLYILDPGAAAIFKHDGTATGAFKAGTIWAKLPSILARANDIAIDGNVYVITKDGAIIKLTRGQQKDFTYHALSPKLGASTKMYTTKESNFLYILDRDNDRIIIMDKQGTIKDQYTSPKFDALNALAVSPAEDELYVLNGKMIYLLAINK